MAMPIIVLAAGLAHADVDRHECADWSVVGQEDAQARETIGAAVGGAVGGLAFSAIGTGLAAGISAAADTTPPYESMVSIPEGYERCYTSGYRQALKKKRVRSSVIAGIPGTLLWFLLIL